MGSFVRGAFCIHVSRLIGGGGFKSLVLACCLSHLVSLVFILSFLLLMVGVLVPWLLLIVIIVLNLL